MMRLRPRSQPSLRKDSTKASRKRALAGVDSDAPERMPTRAIFVVSADTGTAMPPVSKAAPSAKTNLRCLMSTSRASGPGGGSEAACKLHLLRAGDYLQTIINFIKYTLD